MNQHPHQDDRFFNLMNEVSDNILNRLDMPEVTYLRALSRPLRIMLSEEDLVNWYNVNPQRTPYTWVFTHFITNESPTIGYLYGRRDIDLKELVFPMQLLLQNLVPFDANLELLTADENLFLFRLHRGGNIPILLVVNPFANNVQLVEASAPMFNPNSFTLRESIRVTHQDNGFNIFYVEIRENNIPNYFEYSEEVGQWNEVAAIFSDNIGMLDFENPRNFFITDNNIIFFIRFENGENQPIFTTLQGEGFADMLGDILLDPQLEIDPLLMVGDDMRSMWHYTGTGLVAAFRSLPDVEDDDIVSLRSVFILKLAENGLNYDVIGVLPDGLLMPEREFVLIESCVYECSGVIYLAFITIDPDGDEGGQSDVIVFRLCMETGEWTRRTLPSRIDSIAVDGPAFTNRFRLLLPVGNQEQQ